MLWVIPPPWKYLKSFHKLLLIFNSVYFDKTFVTHKDLHHWKYSFNDNLFTVECISVNKGVQPLVSQYSIISTETTREGWIRILIFQLCCHTQCLLCNLIWYSLHFSQLFFSNLLWCVSMCIRGFKHFIAYVIEIIKKILPASMAIFDFTARSVTYLHINSSLNHAVKLEIPACI